ncbi:MAG TPA: hypothetical protein VK843_08180 [Planctomycetota bacterium]|nr:hypothetical protein [Planctomycetota bacterium]
MRTIPGPVGVDLFGLSLRALRLNPKATTPLLAIDGLGVSQRNPAVIIDPTTGAIVFELAGVKSVQGVQHDSDGDGIRELVVTAARAPAVVELLSGATGRPIEGSALPANARLIDVDLDGDGYFDFYRLPKGFDTDIEFLSAKSKKVLTRLSLTDAPAPRPWSFATTAADVDGDGRSDLLLYWSDIAASASQLLAFNGSRFESHNLLAHGPPLPRRGALAFHKVICNLGDVDGDGSEDVLIPCAAGGREALICHSGTNGKPIWEVPGVGGAEWTSIDRVKDLDDDGIADVICGKVRFSPDDEHKGPPGRVSLLSGRTGATLKTIHPNWQRRIEGKSKPRKSEKDPPSPPALVSQRWDPDCSLFGLSIANLGDNNGDGEEEIAIGAPAAWTDAGRTGAVLIIGAKHGRLLHSIAGTRHDGEFGFSVSAMRTSGNSNTARLAVSEGGMTRFFDTTSWKSMAEESSSKRDCSLDLDFDGDGVVDLYREPRDWDSELAILSGASHTVLALLPMGNPRGKHQTARMTHLAADFDGDGRRDLAVVWPNIGAERSEILLFSGPRLDKRTAIDLSKQEFIWSGQRDYYTCGDLNRDACEDLLVAQTEFPQSSLTCYSGANGSLLWTAPDVVDEDATSVDRLGDLDGDGVNEVITGKVHYSTTGGYGDGIVIVLSGSTGRIVKQFVEGDYPTIGLANYLDSHGK